MADDKEVKCPWCGAQVIPRLVRSEKESGTILERKCPECVCTLAAYLGGEGNFFPEIRVFENE